MDTSYYVDTYYGYNAANSSIVGGMFVFMVIMWIISIIIGVIGIVSLWKIFKKAGKPGWAALIPFYNYYVMCEIAEKQWWHVLLLFVPIAQIYSLFVVYDGVSKKFGKSTGFSVGMLFLPYVFLPILAFSDAQMIDKNKGFGSTNLEQSVQNVDANIVDNNTNNMNQGYVAPSFETPATPSTEQPVNNVSQPMVNNDINQGSPMNNMNQGYVDPSFETPVTPVTEEHVNNVSQPMVNNDINQGSSMNNMNQGYVAPSSTTSTEQPANNVLQPAVNNDANQGSSMSNMNQGYVATSFETPATPSIEEPVNNISQQVVENNVNQSEPNQNSAQSIEPNEAIISAEKPHTSFWSNRNNQ